VRHTKGAVLWGVAVCIACALGFFAGRAAFAPPAVDVVASRPATYQVVEATVGRSSTFAGSATWPTTAQVYGAAEGTVTSVDVSAGQSVSAGDRLYSVDLRPIVVAAGQVPSFRELSSGMSGADVRQLNQFLHDTGYLTGSVRETFTSATSSAVKRWQRDLGLERTGVVLAGDLLFLPSLPARVSLTEEVATGSPADPAKAAVEVLGDAPHFSFAIDSNSDAPAVGSVVEVSYGDLAWTGVVAALSARDDMQSGLIAEVTAPDGASLCGETCAELPLDLGDGSLSYRVQVVPEQSGPTVPISALGTASDSSVFTLTEDGARLNVEILVTDGSRAVVSGVDVGQTIRLFADDEADTAGSSQDSADGTQAGDARPAGSVFAHSSETEGARWRT
jgi:peptidoglycan hydrolase-like protein with peptidoglycan-binding domain